MNEILILYDSEIYNIPLCKILFQSEMIYITKQIDFQKYDLAISGLSAHHWFSWTVLFPCGYKDYSSPPPWS